MKISAAKKQLLLYAIAMAALLFWLKWLETRLVIFTNAFEIYAGLIALIFTILGIWIAKKLTPKPAVIAKESNTIGINGAKAASLNISPREREVLELMAHGLSNAEIADRLFVTTNTVKTHVSSLFSKLESGKRMQAIEKARRLGLITQRYENPAAGENHPKG